MGDFLFKYRGQIPILLFLLVIPFIWKTDYSSFSNKTIVTNNIISIIISFFGLLIRFYTVGKTPGGTSGRNRSKQIAKKINTKGIYSITRNPLYFGNYLIWLGISIFSLNTFFTILLSFFFFFYYGKIIKTEEKFLFKKFGNSFIEWKKRTPGFFPSFKKYKSDKYSLSIKTILKREYSSLLATIFSFFYISTLINLKLNSNNLIDRKWLTILVITITVTIILRAIKRNTNLLNQKGRT
ncbi:MAG: lipid A phosphate methyltransferase [Flavobacteriales bacterium]|nr:lipid A phosphate methyltransferase [Flavobacteriales bacterium]